jgi:gluconate 2-dehydrogenase gamma chain
MSNRHDESRRTFLKSAVIGAGAAGVAFAPEARALTNEQRPALSTTTDQAHAHGAGHGAFFNDDDAATVAAFAERLMPGAPGSPGATDANVLNYIDLALAGAYSEQQDFYRRGLAALDAYCRKTHNAPFVKLDAAGQDEVIAGLEQNKASGFAWPTASAFFNTVRTHTMEGMFADPVYGGNKDFAGWRLVGFPGAHPAFSPEDMASKEAFAGGVLIGLQAQSAARRS